MIITSASNEKLKNIKKLLKSSSERREQALYVVEGIRMFREIKSEDILAVYVSQAGAAKFDDELNNMLGNDYQDRDDFYIVSDKIFDSISDTGTPQGILALVKQKQDRLTDVFGIKNEVPFILIVEKLQDPGNLGTILRTAEGAGVTGIIISRDSVDMYNPKVVRSTMGAIFRVPVYVSDDLVKDIGYLKEKDIKVYDAHLKGENIYDKNFKQSCAFLIGNEGSGLSDEVSSTADELIRIPMKGKVESLNAAISTAVIAYEVLRQRI